MRGRVAETVAVSALATLVIVAIAAPVLRSPSERVFGMEIVGRHYDPFTVMEQFGRPVGIGMYSQPLTDIPGALLARVAGAVAAYNWLVLLSFPLSAAAAYLLARYLALSPAAAAVAAMAYAFSPFHLSHAAYHPHVAQTQWLPLYLLALWRCLDRPTLLAAGFLAAATLAVTLSNFYGGLIAAVLTPVAVAAHWIATYRPGSRAIRRLAITTAVLVLMAAAGIGYAWSAAGPVVMNRAAFAFERADLFRYSAKWWSYLVPPAGHPLLGGMAQRVWDAVGVPEALLEQQVSLGWGVVALALVGIVAWLAHVRSATAGERRWPFIASVPVLIIVAVTALVCSLSPERTIGTWVGTWTFVRPSALLYEVLPMFRSYARFGVAVQLMAALLAGIGVDYLRRAGTRRAQIVCLALVAIAAGEYMVWPPAAWRDVLPTSAHRWITRQPDPVRALDCERLTLESASIPWLSGHKVSLLTGGVDDCLEPDLPRKLAAAGYTHVLVRGGTRDGRWLANRPLPDGLRLQARFGDGDVFGVTAEAPAVYTARITAFSVREYNDDWTWRWMGPGASWKIVNTRARPIDAAIGLEVSAFHRERRMELRLDGRPVQTLVIDPLRRVHQIGPLTVPPGEHTLAFHPAEAPTVADEVIGNGDLRPLSFAFGTWKWTVRSEAP